MSPAPGWTSYKHRLHYQTFDVTHLVRDGQNVIGAQVAEGWFCGRLGFLGGVQNIWGDNIGLMAQLHIDFADGTRTIINSDASWTTSTGAILTSELYDGESVTSLEPKGWTEPGFDDSSWIGVGISNCHVLL